MSTKLETKWSNGQMVKWSNNSTNNYLKPGTSPPTFAKQWSLVYFLIFSILLFTFPISSPAEEKTACNTSECNYTVQFDRSGFYIAVVTLPPNQREGVWSLIIDPPTAHLGSFHGGGVLKENGTVPSWVAFSLAQADVVYIDPFNYPHDPVPFRLELMKEQDNKQYQSVWGPTLVNPGQRYTTTSLEPGFYVAVANSTGQKDFFGLSLWSPTLFGGVSGGWLDSQTGVGFAAIDITQPRTVNFKLWFGQIYGDLGAGQPHFQIYYQDKEDTRTLYWSAPQSLQPEYKPKPPLTQLPIDPNTNWEDTVKFLYTGNNPVQTPFVDENGQSVPINIDPNGAVIILGKVVNSLGQPLPGVKVTIEGCQECGQTLTAEGGNFIATGEFALAVNPGTLTVKYEKEGYVPLQRQVEIACSQTVSRINAIALVTRDEGGGLQLSQGSSAAQGGAVSDTSGSRQARLFFPPGTVATMVLPNCSEKQLVDPHIRITEYTQGDPGVEGESTGMPFELPPGTGYTYAVEFSVDEAVKENAREVKFNQPIMSYVDNFLGFPVGVPVPSGYYDYNLEAWIPSENGYVINILGGDASGQPLFDFAGQAIVLSNEEKQQIVQWFGNEKWYQTKQGKSFWRTPLMHFSPIDLNYPRVPDPDAKDPDVPEAPDNDKKEKDPCEKSGCIIEAENQVLGEVLPVAGTPFNLNYRSNRVPGRKASYALDIPLRTETLPQSLKRIRLEIDIGGRRKIEEIFCNEQNPNVKDCNNPAPSVYYFVWDGKDDLGRPLPGSHTTTIKIDYLYNAYYLFPADFAKSFGLEGTVQNNSVRVPARQEIAKSKSYTRQLGGLDARTTEGFGGWTLDIHHVYDNINSVLYEGSGGQRQVQLTPKPSKPEKLQPQPVAEPEPQPEPLPPQVIDLTNDMRVSYCTQQCTTPNQCVADCGKVLVGSARVESDSVQWIGAESANSFAAKSTGDEAFGFTGLSRYLTESASENEWLFQDTQSVSIINPQSFNGSPSLGFFFAPQWAGPLEATTVYSASKAYEPADPPKYGTGMKTVIVRGEGKADDKINPAITLDIALNDAPPTMADAAAQCVPATQETVFTVTPRLKRDSVLLANVQPVQHVIVDLEVKEKNTPQCSSFTDDMVTANSFAFGDYFHYLNEQGPKNPETGCIHNYSFLVSVDKPFQFKALRQHDTQNDTYPKGYVQYAFSVRSHLSSNPAEYQGSYKKFHLASSSTNNRAGSLASVRAGARSCLRTDGELFNGRIASQDGGLLYEFEQSRHVRTLDSLTGQAIYTFGYNDKGYLVKVTDIDGDVTTIERDANNHPVAIVAPYGQRTVLTLDANGYLASAANDAGEVHKLVSTANGLLTQYIDPRNNVEIYEYDVLGLFVKNTTPIGGGYTVAKTALPDGGYVTTLTSREGRKSSYQITTKDGKKARLNTAPDGTATISSEEGDGMKKVVSPDGTEIWSKEEQDSRLVNMFTSPSTKATAIVTPSGKKAEIVTETATNPLPIADDYDPLNLKTLTNKVTVNGRTSTSVFDKTAKTITATSAAGRKSVSVLDEKGRVVKEQAPGFADTTYTYDTRGRLTQVSEGEGVDLRTASLEYDARGNINKVTDALGRQVSFDYDLVGRVTKQMLTDGRQIIYSYDASGNVTTITPPGRPAHSFAYNGEDLQTQYTPPPAGLATPQTQYVYNLDKQLTKVVRPDGQNIEFEYDKTKGRLNALKTPHGTYSYAYDDKSGNLTTVTAPDGNSLGYQYDGSLPLSVTWGGAIKGTLSVTYDNDFRVTTTSINGGSTVNYDYDADSLLVKAGDLWLVRDPENGLLKGTQLGGKDGIVTQRAYNTFGEMVSETATVNGNPLYTNQYSYDKLGRITQKVETLEGVATTFVYDYDPAGRLVKVTQNGAVTEQYSYDGNGNRLSAVTATHGSVTGSYDEQDRLLQYAGNTYSYTANGELLSKTSNGATTQYQYDVLGNLRSVKLPDGKQLEYVIDANGRRVGKKVNGVLTQGWLYQGSLNPIAELDGTGKVVTRFVYGSKANVPDYLVKGDKTYRIISDHLGSPRLVIELSTGAVVQRMDYDAFGNVIQDSDPGFQPFGFAGGLYDSETQLVRFGARDYDAETRRWTAKDSITFASGDTNLYGYVLNDPINIFDSAGLRQIFIGGDVDLKIGAGASLGGGLVADHTGNVGLKVCAGVGVGVGAFVGGGVDFQAGTLNEGITGTLGVEASAQAAFGGGVGVSADLVSVSRTTDICGVTGDIQFGGVGTSIVQGIMGNKKAGETAVNSLAGGVRFGMGATAGISGKACHSVVINPSRIINNFFNDLNRALTRSYVNA